MSGDFMFVTPSSFLPVTLRQVGLVTLACSALVLSACGGGDRAADYQPTSIVSFGDENSAFATATVSGGDGGELEGLTYAVNNLVVGSTTFCTDQIATTLCATPQDGVTSFTATGEPTSGYFDSVNTGDVFNVVTRIDLGVGDYATVAAGPLKRTVDQFYNCTAITIWTQFVARAFGKGYEADCRLDRPGAVTHAVVGAKVADLGEQIDAAQAAGQLKRGALVTLWLGQNDLVEIFDNGALTLAQKEAEAQLRAAALVNGVKRILATDAKVLLVNAPNLAYSPYAPWRSSLRRARADVSARHVQPGDGRPGAGVQQADHHQSGGGVRPGRSPAGIRRCRADSPMPMRAAPATRTSASVIRHRDGSAGWHTGQQAPLAYCHTGTLATGGNVWHLPVGRRSCACPGPCTASVASTALTRACRAVLMTRGRSLPVPRVGVQRNRRRITKMGRRQASR
jgi:hypothetical protein